jgi:phosphomannomutase
MQNKNLLLFDVDGTIAESSCKIDDEMYKLFIELSKTYDLGIVGGGKYEKIKEQLDKSVNLFTHIFAECGCVYYKKFDLIYVKNLRNHNLYPKINILVKLALSFISNVDYQITGNFIDLRNGLIYISLIGMQATQEERKYFIDLDKKYNYRIQLLELLRNNAKDLEIYDEISILEGGHVGIGIYPSEWDKIQVLEVLTEYDKTQIFYFGDKYQEEGNDYNLIQNLREKGFGVNNVNETKNILKKFIVSI